MSGAGWNEVLHMGGYGVYVWGACLAIAVALLAEQVLLRWRRRSILDHLGQSGARTENDDETPS